MAKQNKSKKNRNAATGKNATGKNTTPGKKTTGGKKNRAAKAPTHPAALKLPVPRLRRADEIVTGAQLVAVTAAFFGSDALRNLVAIACIGVFLAGSVLFSWAFLIAAGRSRAEELTVAGAFFLAGSVGDDDRRWAFRLLLAQTVIGFAGAISAPYTTMAFGILVPMFGLGVIAFLGSAHGSFRPRPAR